MGFENESERMRAFSQQGLPSFQTTRRNYRMQLMNWSFSGWSCVGIMGIGHQKE